MPPQDHGRQGSSEASQHHNINWRWWFRLPTPCRSSQHITAERGSLESLSRQQPSQATSRCRTRVFAKEPGGAASSTCCQEGWRANIYHDHGTYRSHHCDATVPPGPVFSEVGSGAPDNHYRPTDPYTISRLSVTASRRLHQFSPKCTYVQPGEESPQLLGRPGACTVTI